MAKTGFTLADNLENITAGKLAMTNLLSVGALPFQFDDLDIFRQNSVQTAKLDFIPNNHTFSIKANAAISTGDTVLDLKNISDSSPGLTFNLSVQPGDIVVGSSDIKISSISRRRNTDIGNAVLDSAIGVSRSVDGSVQFKKQNAATYSPASGKFTFGTDIQFGFANGDKITSVEIKNFSPSTPLDCPTNTSRSTIYPLEVYDRTVTNGQISFKLRRFDSPNSPILFQHAVANIKNANRITNSPSKLTFKSDEVIRFTRLNPVTQSEFLSIVPPNIRLDGGAEELYAFNQAIVASTGAGVTTLFRGFESVSDLYSVNTELGNDEDTYEETVAFQKPIRGINTSVDLTRDIVKTKLDKSKNYLNDSSEEFIVEGVLKIQDPDKVNSPAGDPGLDGPGVVGFLNSPKGLVPAPYIGTDGTFNRAFSTFDGPWDSNSTTSAVSGYVHGGSQPAESIFTKADSPGSSDFVDQIQVPELAFKNTMIFEDFSSPTKINVASDVSVNAAASAGGFNFKMPIKVEETDPDSGEKILVDYFLLLRQET